MSCHKARVPGRSAPVQEGGGGKGKFKTSLGGGFSVESSGGSLRARLTHGFVVTPAARPIIDLSGKSPRLGTIEPLRRTTNSPLVGFHDRTSACFEKRMSLKTRMKRHFGKKARRPVILIGPLQYGYTMFAQRSSAQSEAVYPTCWRDFSASANESSWLSGCWPCVPVQPHRSPYVG